VGGGLSNRVYALAVAATKVYVGGQFQDTGGNPDADWLARWDGVQWHALGRGMGSKPVEALAVAGADLLLVDGSG
jgi:hypothetical protein